MEKMSFKAIKFFSSESLNPYYNGRYSWSYQIFSLKNLNSLNPYYNGRYSWSKTEQDIVRQLLS